MKKCLFIGVHVIIDDDVYPNSVIMSPSEDLFYVNLRDENGECIDMDDFIVVSDTPKFTTIGSYLNFVDRDFTIRGVWERDVDVKEFMVTFQTDDDYQSVKGKYIYDSKNNPEE